MRRSMRGWRALPRNGICPWRTRQPTTKRYATRKRYEVGMSTSTNLEETVPLADGPPKSQGTVIHAGRAISVVFFVTVAARLLSIVSQVLTASAFGAGRTMDAYTVALIVPTTISGILTTAVGAALIPVFV